MNNQTAKEIKRAIKPILDVMKKASSQPGGLDPKGYQRLFKITKSSLELVIGQADKVIVEAECSHKVRPVELINKASTRLGMIPNDIDREEALSNGLLRGHQIKVTELKKQGFTDAEIKSIVPYPQSEIDAHTSKISELKAEAKGIETFLKDGPRYDPALLSKSNLSYIGVDTIIPPTKPPMKLWSDGVFPKHPNDPELN